MRGRLATLGVCLLLVSAMFVGIDNLFEVVENVEAEIIYASHFPSIQDAINAAENGDTVFVSGRPWPSVHYTETLVIDKSIKLIGESRSNTGICGDAYRTYGNPVILVTANDVTISGFILFHGSYGIVTTGSNTNISNNDVRHNTYQNIQLNSNNNVVTDNIIENSKCGILIRNSRGNEIHRNSIFGCGIFLGGNYNVWTDNTIESSNTVNGKPIYYVRNQEGYAIPENAGQIILANCKNMTIENYVLNDVTAGIELGYSKNISVQNNIITNNWYNIYLSHSNENIIYNNTGSNGQFGIELFNSHRNTISNNRFQNNYVEGIFLDSGGENEITCNHISNNGHFWDDDWGYEAWLEWTGGGGFGYEDAGITLENSAKNEVFHNEIQKNWIQARDDRNDSSWDNGYPSGGNFWSDYNGGDKFLGPNQNIPGSDGIGDIPYIIDSNTVDDYPLIKPLKKTYNENLPPIANAESDGYSPINCSILFNGSLSYDPDGIIDLYQWDFGDGTPFSYSNITTHVYDSEGIYNATLSVYDDNREIDSDECTIVVEGIPPICSAGPDLYAFVYENVQFNGSKSFDPDGTIISYEWDFGDKSPKCYEIDPVHNFSAIGVFDVTLVIENQNGYKIVDSCIVTIEEKSNGIPIADAGLNLSVICEELISFNGSNSYDPDGTIVSYQWDFGDGSPISMELNPSHSYSTSGLYNVTLTVWDDEGGMDNNTCVIEVSESPFITLEPKALENQSNEILTERQINDTISNNEFPDENKIIVEKILPEPILPIKKNNNSKSSEDMEFILFGFEDTEEPVSQRKTLAKNSPPILQNLYSHTVFIGKQSSFYIRANDPDINDTLFYIDDSPLFDVNLETGLVSFLPQQEDIGDHIINFTVIDSHGNRDSEQMKLHIKKPTSSILSTESDEEILLIPFLMIPVLLFFIIAVEILEYSSRRKEKNSPKKGLKPEANQNDEQIPEFHNSDDNRIATKSPIHNSVFSLKYSNLDYQIHWKNDFYDSVGGSLDMRISDDHDCLHLGYENRR